MKRALGRREFLKLSGTAAMTGILAGCCPAQDQPTPTLQTAVLTSTPTDAAVQRASGWLEAAADVGLGANDPQHIDLVELILG